MKQKLTFLMTAVLLLTMNAFTAFGQDTYEKVTSEPSDWTGEYLLVYEANAETAYAWTGVDVASCYAEMTIVGSGITADEAVTITIEAMDGGYSIMVNGGDNDGKYIYGQSGSNALKFGDSPSLNTLELDADGVLMVSNTSVMRFNNASNNLRFRYYKESTYTAQQPVQLYKKGGSGVPTVTTPSFNPGTGVYFEPQTVTISCNTEGASVYYTTDGSEPTESSTLYTEPLSITENTVLKARGFKSDHVSSNIATATYTFPELVTIAEASGLTVDAYALVQGVIVFIDNRNIYVQDETGGICLFLNSNTVPEGLALGDMVQACGKRTDYNGLRELASINGGNENEFKVISTGNALPLEVKTVAEINEGAGGALQCTRVKLNSVTLGATEGNNTPLTQGEDEIIIYKMPELTDFEAGDIVDVIGVVGYYNAAQIRVYDVSDIMAPAVEAPIFTPASGIYPEPQEVTVSCATEGATIYYSLASTEGPWTAYDAPIAIEESKTVWAYAEKEGYTASAVASAEYIIQLPLDPMIEAFMPLYIQGNNGTNNNRVPVAVAAYIGILEPNTTYRYTNQFVDDNDAPETLGAGNVIYANTEGFYRTTNPSLSTEGGYGEFTTDEDGIGFAWFINESTANARFTPGNHVYLRIRLNDGHDGTSTAYTLTTEDYATVLNFGTENDENSGTAFYVKSEEDPMNFVMMFADDYDDRPTYSTSIETTGVDYADISQYADFYKEEVAGNDGWFGGIWPNNNEYGINIIWVIDMESYVINDYYATDGQWPCGANTANLTGGLDEPVFIDLTYDGVEEESVEANVKVWSAGNEFVVENGDDAEYTMTVFNVLGQPMMSKTIGANSTQHIGHSLTTGLYVISLQNNLNKVSIKVIVR